MNIHRISIAHLVQVIIHPKTIAILYAFFSTPILIVMILVVPPLSAPDEFTHLFRADTLSSGEILAIPGPTGVIGGNIDASLLELFHIVGPTAGIAAPIAAERATQARHLTWAATSTFMPFPNTGQYGPALYIPQALGLALGRGIGLSVILSYTFARLLGGLAAIGIASAAIAQTGRGAFVVAVILSTPMFLFLAASVSQDGMLIAAAALFAARAAKPRSPASDGGNWITWLLALIMTMGRLPYGLLSVLMIRGRRGRPTLRWLRAPDGPLAPLLLFAIALIWLIAVGALSQPSVTPFPDVDPSAQMAGLMKHPLSIWQIAGQTLTSAEYFNVSRSVVGILGCLNVTLSPWVYAVGLDAILLAASTCFLQVSGRSPLYHITAALLFALSIGAIYGALYLTWTPAGAGAVSGFQGRYLLPYLVGLPLLIPALVPARWSIHRGRALARDIAVGAAGFAAWGMMIVIVADALFTLHDVYGSVFSGPWYSAASQ